ncbi:Leucine Rich Repeat [Seminavis robusta]|uniref:Leucine Rich Repeat n=1 Tax=Seminavis robusta TaxID=568900 RepID=A0A9N8E8X6_9STRA|nr:Leucine Rich Repeat [Seminavis robusta]|eukprot:Sro678_g185930.1 Leucine Rich Repeat (804) ;mRNA; f:24660-27272
MSNNDNNTKKSKATRQRDLSNQDDDEIVEVDVDSYDAGKTARDHRARVLGERKIKRDSDTRTVSNSTDSYDTDLTSRRTRVLGERKSKRESSTVSTAETSSMSSSRLTLGENYTKRGLRNSSVTGTRTAISSYQQQEQAPPLVYQVAGPPVLGESKAKRRLRATSLTPAAGEEQEEEEEVRLDALEDDLLEEAPQSEEDVLVAEEDLEVSQGEDTLVEVEDLEAPAINDNDGLAEARPVEENPDLPQAQQVDEAAEEAAQKKSMKKSREALARYSLVAITCLLVGFLLGMLVGSKDDEAAPAVSTGTAAPKQNDSATATLSPSLSWEESFMQNMLPMSTIKAIKEDPASPQAMAFNWLLDDFSTQVENDVAQWKQLQRFVLATFYYSTNGQAWLNNSLWLSNEDECFWYSTAERSGGIIRDYSGEFAYEAPDISGGTCGVSPANLSSSQNDGDDEGKFQHLWLNQNGLEGQVPEELWLLTSLKSLSFKIDNFKASIPPAIGQLTNLEALNFGGIDLRGSHIPTEIGLCSSLKVFLASRSGLSGTIPSEIGRLLKLEYFWVDDENSLSGSLPTQIGLLSDMVDFQFYNAGFLTGRIPSEIGLLTALTDLNLYAAGELSGTIPSQLGLLSSIQFIGMARNQLTGTLPTELGLLSPTLGYMVIGENQLVGTIPSELGLLRNLWELTMDKNKLTGTCPSEIGNIGQFGMRTFWLNDNLLEGLIPSELGRFPYLQYFSLSNNDFSGAVPEELELLSTGLVQFEISGNPRLSGLVPSELCWLNGTIEAKFDCTESLCGCNCNCSTAGSL